MGTAGNTGKPRLTGHIYGTFGETSTNSSASNLFYDEYLRIAHKSIWFKMPKPAKPMSFHINGKASRMAQFALGDTVTVRIDADKIDKIDSESHLGRSGQITDIDECVSWPYRVVFEDGTEERFSAAQLTGVVHGVNTRLAASVFVVGDRVQIKSNGQQYTTADEYAQELGLTRFKSGENMFPGKYTILSISADGKRAGLVDQHRRQYVFGITGGPSSIVILNSTEKEKKNMPEPEFYVGQKVVYTGTGCATAGHDEVVTVRELSGTSVYFTTEAGNNCSHHKAMFKLSNNQGDNTMSQVKNDPVKAVMEAELDADTRLLREYGFEETTGVVAENGKKAIMQQLWSERRAAIATKFRQALATEEAADKEAAAKAAK